MPLAEGRRLPRLLVVVLAGIGISRLAAAAAPSTSWLTGAALQKRLGEPVDVYWSGMPLREAVCGLSRAQRVALLLDRRVDPGRELNLKRSGLPFEAILREIAESRQLGLCWLGPVAYLAPPQVSCRVRTVAELRREEIRTLPPAVQKKFFLPRPIRWDDLATPRELLARLAADRGIEVSGLDQVPHDLWAGADLPPLSLVDQITLIAGQFDLTFQVAADGSSIALVPIPGEVVIERSYPGGSRPEQLAQKWAALAPQSRIRVVGSRIMVRGLLEDHERIAGASEPARPPSARLPRRDQGQKRFTLRVTAPLGQVLDALTAKLQLELDIDRAALRRAGISLQQPVTVNVEEATFDELFEAVLKPAGCTFQHHDQVIEIRPAR